MAHIPEILQTADKLVTILQELCLPGIFFEGLQVADCFQGRRATDGKHQVDLTRTIFEGFPNAVGGFALEHAQVDDGPAVEGIAVPEGQLQVLILIEEVQVELLQPALRPGGLALVLFVAQSEK